MKATVICLLGVLLVVGLVVVQSPASAQGTVYYRGYFDGEVDLLDKGLGWYTYKPAPNSAYRLFEQRHTSPWWRPDEEKEKGKRLLDRSRKRVHTLNPLPGQYYYKKPAHYNFITPLGNLGWPYRKYNSRYW